MFVWNIIEHHFEFAFATLNLHDLQFEGFPITSYYSFVILYLPILILLSAIDRMCHVLCGVAYENIILVL